MRWCWRWRCDFGLDGRPGELLVWQRVLAPALQPCPEEVDKLELDDLDALPYLHLLLKDHRDQQELGESGRMR